MVSIRETQEGKSAEEFNSLPFKDPPLKETNPSRSGQNVIPGTHLPASEAEVYSCFSVVVVVVFSPARHISRFLSQGRRDFFWGNNQQTATFLNLYAHLFSVSLKQSPIVGGWRQGINVSVHINKRNVPHLVVCHAAFHNPFL